MTQYHKHTKASDNDSYLMSSPPLPPRHYVPFSPSPASSSPPVSSPPLPPRTYSTSRKPDPLFGCVPPPASATGFPVPMPRTSLKKLVTSPGPLLDMASTSEDIFQPPPPQRSSSSPLFSETGHYWTLAEMAAGTGPHCRFFTFTYIRTRILDNAHNSQAQSLNLRRGRLLGGKRTADINNEQ